MFVPFETVNLYLYIVEHLISPLKYHKQEFKSVQNYFPNHILISKTRWVENCNISIEVEIDKSELIKLDDNFFLYPKTLLINHNTKIWFQSQEKMEIATVNIEISTTYFPKQLIQIDKEFQLNQISFSFEKYQNIKTPQPKNIANKIITFSKLLGLSAIYKNILNQDKFSLSKFTSYSQIEKIINHRNITNVDIETFAKQENIKLEKFLHFYQFKNLNPHTNTYISIILKNYDYKMSDNLAGLIEETKHLDTNLQKTFLLLYGLMLGYDKLPFLGIDTKFRFDKKSDFDILETIYRKAFKEKIKKADRLEQLKTNIFEKNFDELLEKFGVSETTLKPNIRQTILESDISISAKIELFEKFNLRVPKNLRITKLKEIFKNGKFTSKELAEKL